MYICVRIIGLVENWVDGLIFRGERLGKGMMNVVLAILKVSFQFCDRYSILGSISKSCNLG